MVALTYGDARTATPETKIATKSAAAPQKSFFARLLTAMIESRMRQAEISGRAHPSVGVSRVLHIADSPRLARRVSLRDAGAVVSGAVIDQNQFPLRRILRQHAIDRFLNEACFIEEDDDRGYARRRTHPTILRTRQANALSLQSSTARRGKRYSEVLSAIRFPSLVQANS